MHEILAPLLFVLYSDQQTFEHYVENDALRCAMFLGELTIVYTIAYFKIQFDI